MEKYFLFPAFLLKKIDANIALHKNWRQPVYTVECKFMWRHFDLHNLYKSIALFCIEYGPLTRVIMEWNKLSQKEATKTLHNKRKDKTSDDIVSEFGMHFDILLNTPRIDDINNS